MNRVFNYLNALPWTKPVAIITWLGVVVMIAASFLLGKDVPSNTKEVCIYFGGIVFAAATGKSAYESVRRRSEEGAECDGRG